MFRWKCFLDAEHVFALADPSLFCGMFEAFKFSISSLISPSSLSSTTSLMDGLLPMLTGSEVLGSFSIGFSLSLLFKGFFANSSPTKGELLRLLFAELIIRIRYSSNFNFFFFFGSSTFISKLPLSLHVASETSLDLLSSFSTTSFGFLFPISVT